MVQKEQVFADFIPLTPRLSWFHTSKADFVPLQTVNLAPETGVALNLTVYSIHTQPLFI
jgi:hypothetical protein